MVANASDVRENKSRIDCQFACLICSNINVVCACVCACICPHFGACSICNVSPIRRVMINACYLIDSM